MKKLKNNKMLLGIGITFLLLATIGMSYAWFSATVTRENSHDQIVTTGTLELTYIDGPEIKLENVRPGKTLTKEVSVKNTGTLDAEYNLVWQELNNEITNDEMVISITCSTITDKNAPGEACPELAETPISENVLIEGATIESGYTHNYVITITFKELSKDQNYNQGKNFSGVLGVNEYNSPATQYCIYDGTISNNTTYTKGIYTYTYSTSSNGWSVVLTDKSSTDPITEAPCITINDKPIKSMYNMFKQSAATTIDTSSFNTSNVHNMNGMFANSSATELIGLEKLDTSNVQNMSNMFYESAATSLNLNSFNTSIVTDMSNMFRYSKATSLDLSSFNTSKVTNMSNMFYGSAATSLNLNSFNTGKVTNMSNMFYNSKATSLDVSSFDTSNVTNMTSMFSGSEATTIKGLNNFKTSNVTTMQSMFHTSKATSLDVSSFDTSKVTYMFYMFSGGAVTSLDLSNFDTSNVTNMQGMFENTKITSIKGLNKFNTSSATNISYMFYSSEMTSLDLSSFNTKNVENMSRMFSYNLDLTTIYVGDNFITSNATDSTDMFIGAKKLVGGSGTKYNASYVDKTYARIDTASTPGYFTRKTN